MFRFVYRFLPVLLFCSFVPAFTAWGGEALEILRRKAESLENVSADFVQESSIPLFAQPMLSYGRFVFKRPASLRWEYTNPIREGFVLNGDKGFRWDNDSPAHKPFSPSSNPLAAIVARQMIAWITYDLESIGREYSIQSLPGPDMRLQMTPLRDDVRGVINAIVITFTPEGPASLVEIREAAGGGTSIRFNNTVVNGPPKDHEFE